MAVAAPYTHAESEQSSASVFNIDTKAITLSGLSSGGYMATQFHLAHADIVSGVGVMAAGPYNCARGSIATAFAECIDKAPEQYPKEIFSPFDEKLASQNDMKDDKVWLFHGNLDTRIHADVAEGLFKQYSEWTQAENLIYVNDKPIAHVFPTDRIGDNCKTSESPFIGDCGYDAAGELLHHIIGSLQPKVSQQQSLAQGKLIKFEQAKLTSLSGSGLNENGFVYLPDTCKDGNVCQLHVSFHGCNQSIDNVQDSYAKSTGLNQWAASNRMIVLYPQVEKSSLMPMNPQACWDWWGYTDSNYANKEGKQITAIYNMVQGLSNYLSQEIN